MTSSSIRDHTVHFSQVNLPAEWVYVHTNSIHSCVWYVKREEESGRCTSEIGPLATYCRHCHAGEDILITRSDIEVPLHNKSSPLPTEALP